MSNAQHDPASPGTSVAADVAAAHAGLPWHRSTYSGGANNCVEAAGSGASVRVRDSKSVPGPMLAVAPAAWGEFLGRVGRSGSAH
ncbi:DUF397 domain-containing protein [Yinghuangia soli]|uniref:DUF397 domain-containing protein n=1 Tax=Yinghuangia soli TaxID=2908204 RepID=A0AA41PUM7_9ACTN|nr:DUF397 domain-containing protein [Yinghuangia soli]MCF2526178.1 DUF397 domain-containing protein [Yinghuangia soli]